MKKLLMTIPIVALTALASACRVAPLPAPRAQAPVSASASQAMLKPGDKVGEMTLIKGSGALDPDVPPLVAFCNTNPQLEPGSSVSKPGTYTVECTVPPLPKMAVGFGWFAKDEKLRDSNWAALSTELYVNGQQVDQAAFGKYDADIVLQGMTSDDAAKQTIGSEASGKLRVYDVILENLKPGTLTMRWVWRPNQEVFDGWLTNPAGTYDITWKMTIQEPDASKKAP